MYGELALFGGNANPDLAGAVAKRLGRGLVQGRVGRFSDGETRVEIHENIRGRDVFLFQPTNAPANDHLMELLVMAEACKRSSAGRITAVVPYFGYARQDRKVAPRAPITARLVADLMQASGIERVLTMDLHAGQIQGFFNIPVDNLYAQPVLLADLRKRLAGENAIIVSPDAGGVERARSYAKVLDLPLAIIDKRRSGPNEAEVTHIVGDVGGKLAVVIDDMIDTAGTLTKGGEALMNHGAARIMAVATHAVFSGPAIERIAASPFERIVVTDTIPLGPEAIASKRIDSVSVADLLAQAIEAIHRNDSISRLFLLESELGA